MITVMLLFLCIGLDADAQQQVSLGAIAPPSPTSVGAAAFGARGGTILYYWVIARYPGGASAASMSQAFGTVGGGNLTGSNFVRVSWASAVGATGYDVLRSDVPIFPGPTCASCAVALNISSTSFDDTGVALSAYPPVGLNAAVPVQGVFSINNRDAASPFLNFQLLSIRINEVLRVGLISGTPADDDCMKYSGGRLVSAGAACGSGSGSMTRCQVIATGDTITIFVGATVADPCNITFGSTVRSFSGSASYQVTGGSGADSVAVEVLPSGVIQVLAGTRSGVCTGCTAIAGSAYTGVPVWEWTITATTFNASGGTRRLGDGSKTPVQGGTDISCVETAGVVTCSYTGTSGDFDTDFLDLSTTRWRYLHWLDGSNASFAAGMINGGVGAYGGGNANSDLSVYNVSGVRGAHLRNTDATANGGVWFTLYSNAALSGNPLFGDFVGTFRSFDIRSKVQIPDVTNIESRFAILPQASYLASPANALNIVLDTRSSANFQCQIINGGTPTTVDSGVAATSGAQYELRLTATATGTLTCCIGATCVNAVAAFPAVGSPGLNVAWNVENVAAAARAIVLYQSSGVIH